MRPDAERTNVKATLQSDDRLRRLDRLDALAARMDRAFRIPFLPIRFGWDSILGLVPGVGDTLALAPAFYILQQAHSMGASRPVLPRMSANIGVDWLVGLVPLVGDLFDVRVKSNTRNTALLRQHLAGQKLSPQSSP
jgi:hypothetical protein